MKKGVSPVIATVILLTLTILLGLIIFKSSSNFITELSPPADCPDVAFEAKIIGNILEVNNIGNENLAGFKIIRDNKKGSIDTQEIAMAVPKGRSEQKEISLDYQLNTDDELKLIPEIIKEGKLVVCDESFGKIIEYKISSASESLA